MNRAPRIFISYRRSDTKWAAGRLYDRLVAVLGEDNLFLDVSNIELGRDFVREIEQVVGTCDVLLALIGKDWHNCAGEGGKRRIDNARDLIRVEIATALNRDIRVIPILIDGARLPEEEELPADIAALSRRNARQVSFENFHSDIDSFIRVLERILAGPAAPAQTVAEATRKQDEANSPAPFATVLPFTVSLETFGGVATPLIPKGQALPADATEVFSTAADNQTAVEMKLLAGERGKAADNVSLGTFQLGEIAIAPKGVPQIKLRASVDPSLVLVVTAEDLASGRKKVLDAVDLSQVQVPASAMEADAGEIPNKDSPADFSLLDFSQLFRSKTPPPIPPETLDVETRLSLSSLDAESWVVHTVNGPQGALKVRIPPGTKSGSRLRVRGAGKQDGKKRGDLYVVVTVQRG